MSQYGVQSPQASKCRAVRHSGLWASFVGDPCSAEHMFESVSGPGCTYSYVGPGLLPSSSDYFLFSLKTSFPSTSLLQTPPYHTTLFHKSLVAYSNKKTLTTLKYSQYSTFNMRYKTTIPRGGHHHNELWKSLFATNVRGEITTTSVKKCQIHAQLWTPNHKLTISHKFITVQ